MSQKVLKIVEKKNLWFLISLVIIIIGILQISYRSINRQPILNFGIDFISGSTLLLKFDNTNPKDTTLAPYNYNDVQFIQNLRSSLKKLGLDKSAIQITSNAEVLIKTTLLEPNVTKEVLENLKKEYGTIEILEIDYIGPSIGAELRKNSIWIIIAITITLLIYISWRFKFIFGVAALFALVHDALITLTYTALTGLEVNTAYVAAILTILGYSINDTIIIFDRIRQNIRIHKSEKSNISHLVNLSLTQTMRRTFYTSITTLTVVMCLLLFGGSTIKEFCIVLLVGVLSGTYSSIFIASPVLVLLNKQIQK